MITRIYAYLFIDDSMRICYYLYKAKCIKTQNSMWCERAIYEPHGPVVNVGEGIVTIDHAVHSILVHSEVRRYIFGFLYDRFQANSPLPLGIILLLTVRKLLKSGLCKCHALSRDRTVSDSLSDRLSLHLPC